MTAIPDMRERRKYRARLAATGLVILTASLIYQPGPTEATAIAYGCAVTVLALLLTEWRPRRAR